MESEKGFLIYVVTVTILIILSRLQSYQASSIKSLNGLISDKGVIVRIYKTYLPNEV